MSDTPRPPTGNRRPVLFVLLLFVAPLAAAFWLYYGSTWRPARHTNHGTLITPPVTLPEVALPLAGNARGASGSSSGASAVGPAAMDNASLLRGKWTLLVIGHGESGCDTQCQETLVYARQTWLSLAQLTPRVQRVLLAGPGCCETAYLKREHAGLIALDASGPTAAPLLHGIPEPTASTLFIVDPLGNLMMRYDVRQDPKGLREDLKKLLELSHIG